MSKELDLFGEPISTEKRAAATPTPKIIERTPPDSWIRMLQSVPEVFRKAVLDSAWATYDKVWANSADKEELSRITGTDMRRNAAVSTALSNTAYAMLLPYHLAKGEQIEEAKELLRKSGHDFLMWTKQHYPGAERVLVLGDAVENSIDEILDERLRDHPASALLCGPGKTVENVLRNYGRARHYVTACIESVDFETKGANWEQVPGAKLDKLVARVFAELKPDRVIAFDPVRMPATLQVLDEARKRQIPVLYIDAPAPVRRMAP